MFFDIIREIFPEFEDHQATFAFRDLPIDSFDLMTIRIHIEKRLGQDIPDAVWVQFRNFQDIQDYYEKKIGAQRSNDDAEAFAQRSTDTRRIHINMPQMALGGLAENWLFKEMGDLHWMMICAGLGKPSDRILDEMNNRLYATFVRIRFESDRHLKEFKENEVLTIRNHLSRFGKTMFFSDGLVKGEDKNLIVSLMSTFALRQSDNTTLLRGQPSIPPDSQVEEKLAMPTFGEEYRAMKNASSHSVQLSGEQIGYSQEIAFEMEYEFNPYQDFNGVNLLYFAAYPVIHDICERAFVHQGGCTYQVKRDWALEASTLARDVFYLGNCNIGDAIIFRLNSFEILPNGKVKMASSLYRKSDRQCLAKILTVKVLHG